jgi:hypothetical protein
MARFALRNLLVLSVVLAFFVIGGTALATPPTGSISGTVTFAGPPADNANACVTANGSGGASAPQQVDPTTGAYTINGLADGDYTVTLSDCNPSSSPHWVTLYDDGFGGGTRDINQAAPVTVSSGGDTPDNDFQAIAGGVISGHVYDDNTQSPTALNGMCVKVFDQSQEQQVDQVETANGGAYQLVEPVGESVTIFFGECPNAVAPHYVGEWYNGAGGDPHTGTPITPASTATTGINGSLTQGGAISGTVTGDGTQPTAGDCVVAVQSSQFDPRDAEPVAEATVTQGNGADGGNYVLGSLPAGDYQIYFTSGFYCFDESAPNPYYLDTPYGGGTDFSAVSALTVTAGQTNTASNTQLVRGATISGNVKGTPTGGSLENLQDAGVTGFNVNPDFLGDEVSFASTDSNGNYVLGPFNTGSYHVFFQDFDSDFMPQWYNGKNGSYSTESTLGPSDAVKLDQSNSSNDGSDAAGLRDQGGIDASLIPGAKISGTVTLAGNKPDFLNNDSVCGIAKNESTGDSFFTDVSADSFDPSTQGQYTFEGLPTGSYKIGFFYASDCEPQGVYPYLFSQSQFAPAWWSTNASVGNPGNATAIPVVDHSGGSPADATGKNVDLTAPGAISGTVTGSAGGQDVYVEADLVSSDSVWDGFILSNAITGTDGTYTLSQLSTSSYKVHYYSSYYYDYNYAPDQWYHEALTADAATPVAVTAPNTTSNINEDISGVSGGFDDGSGGTYSNGSEASSVDPVVVSIDVPNGTGGGEVSLSQSGTTTTPPSGYSLLGVQYTITAPDATVNNPLALTFIVDSSLLSGVDTSTLTLLRNGVPAADCADGASATTANPDPCVKSRTLLGSGDLAITILSSHASTWNVVKTVPSGGGGGNNGGGDNGGGSNNGGGSTPTAGGGTTTTVQPSTTSTTPSTTSSSPAKTKCVVPKLIGLTLKKAKKALAKAHCGVGKIAKKKNAKIKGKKAKKGVVVASSPKAGTKKPAGSKVALTLAQ